MKSGNFKYGILAVVYLALQVLLLRNLALFDVAFAFIYVAIILSIPLETDRIVIILAAFVLGIIVDTFYNSLGVHASALVGMAFLRYHWVNAITPQGGYDANVSPTINSMGAQWFTGYALPLIFIHHAILFYTEAGGLHFFWFTLLKVLSSTFFTFSIVIIIQVLFYNRKRNL